MTASSRHTWLRLVDQSGPFLTAPVAAEVWPAGMPATSTERRATLRAALAKIIETDGRARDELARAVFSDLLSWGETLVQGPDLPAALAATVEEHGVVVVPDFAFFDAGPGEGTEDAEVEVGSQERAERAPEPSGTTATGSRTGAIGRDLDDADIDDADIDTDYEDDGAPRIADPDLLVQEAQGSSSAGPWKLLGMWVPWGRHPLARRVEAGWTASPVERLAALLRARRVPVGLVTDGRWWALVWAPRGKATGAAVFDATIWSEEPETLDAFVALLERHRFTGVSVRDRLPQLLERSLDAQEEITVALGAQVRSAVEMLVDRLAALDQESTGSILAGVSDDDLYLAVVSLMMRIVFVLFAEDRRLLPSDHDRYEHSYSFGRLVTQLEERAALNGERTLEHRTGAWHRLLALSRALHGGVAHEDLRLPPYGGVLFDPSRFPWLEGTDDVPPPPVDDLSVLRMLTAVQYVTLQGERRRLSFRTLDVEQIGYVYEGLLELEVRTATEPVVKLRRQGKRPLAFVTLTDAVVAATDPETWAASAYVGEKKPNATRRAAAARWLAQPVPAPTTVVLRQSFGDRAADVERLAPLFLTDERGRPAIVPAGGRYVGPSQRRVVTGAHYTPRSLTETIVAHALEPLCYRPGPTETLVATSWVLRPSTDLLALRVADVAMGSGAFLVAVCRYLADRLVEAWEKEGDEEATRHLGARPEEIADAEVAPVVLRARRLVAEHCLYGVDVNPLAVEMAKLSLWLVTMDKERPFGFVDDRVVCGDSLLGLFSLDQLEHLHVDPGRARSARLGGFDFAAPWKKMLAAAADTRRRITATPVLSVRDVEHKARLLSEAEVALGDLHLVADAVTGAGVRAARMSTRERARVFGGLEQALWAFTQDATTGALETYRASLDAERPAGKEPRRPLHWPLVFPEVFADTPSPGFDAIVGNPPFLGGQRISGALGKDYLAWLVAWDGRGQRGSADLAARFVLRADDLLRSGGQLGYVTTNTLVEGDTLEVGLLQLERRGWCIRRANSAHAWPSRSANLSVVEVWATKGQVEVTAVLDTEPVPRLTVDLQPYLREKGRPARLAENEGIAFQGSIVLGLGFTVTPEEAHALIAEDPRNAQVLFPYVNGADLNRRPDSSASRWIINFFDWPLERAERYHAPMERVRTLVKPERDQLLGRPYATAQRRGTYWWLYAGDAKTLYERIAPLDHVLAIVLHASTVLPLRVPTKQVFSHACGVFALDDFASLAVLSSSPHHLWAIRYGSTMRTDIRYTPSDVFLTFPRPASTPELDALGRRLDAERRELMLGRNLGLTKLYNLVHDPDVVDPAIAALRALHEEVDRAVLTAYGWGDLTPEIGHHPTKIGIRWTFSPRARFELLDRLLAENHRRARAP